MESSPLIHRSARRWLAAFGLLVLGTVGGCNMLAALGYIAHEDNAEAEFDKLSGKRVAVVCRPVEELQYSDRTAAPDLAAAVGELLKQHVKKIQIISPSEVRQWTDERNWQEYSEVGKGLKADVVVGIDLEGFSLNQGQTLYQGRSNVHLWVYDMKDGGHKPAFEKRLPPTVYPPNSSLPATDRPEAEFRTQYLAVLAEHIARLFYPHDPRADFASDANVLND